MSNTMRMYATAGVLAAVASTASAGFQSVDARFDGRLDAESNVSGIGDLRDDREFNGNLRYQDISDDGMPVTAPTTYNSSFGVDSRISGFGGYATQGVTADLGNTFASFETSITAGAAGTQDPLDANGYLNLQGRFELDLFLAEESLVEFTLRIELVPGAFSQEEPSFNAFGRVELSGSDTEMISLDNQDPGVLTLTTTQLVSTRAFMQADWDLQVDSGDGLEAVDLFYLSAEARIVPAPGTAAALGLAGLVAARRRRH